MTVRNIYTENFLQFPEASDGDRTRDTNLEGWDVTATPHSQKKTEISPQSKESYHIATYQQEQDHPKYHP